jgi:hypothetical protein
MKSRASIDVSGRTFSAHEAEKIFAVTGLFLGLLILAFAFLSNTLDRRQAGTAVLALVISQLNLRSWRLFVELCSGSVSAALDPGRGILLSRFFEMLILKCGAIGLLVWLYLEGGFPAVELALLTLVMYLISGALILAFLQWKKELGAAEPRD